MHGDIAPAIDADICVCIYCRHTVYWQSSGVCKDPLFDSVLWLASREREEEEEDSSF